MEQRVTLPPVGTQHNCTEQISTPEGGATVQKHKRDLTNLVQR